MGAVEASGVTVSDEATLERHQRHETALDRLEASIAAIEKEQIGARLWRTGNGTPHRGAEARITRIEEGAMMKSDVQQMIKDTISARQRSALAIITALAPYVGLIVMVLIYAKTGNAPVVAP